MVSGNDAPVMNVAMASPSSRSPSYGSGSSSKSVKTTTFGTENLSSVATSALVVMKNLDGGVT